MSPVLAEIHPVHLIANPIADGNVTVVVPHVVDISARAS
jgi:hypothetical protein